VPCHLQPAVKVALGLQPELKRTEEAVGKILSLPIYPDLGKEEVDFVGATIKNFFGKGGS
jgi:dTDP-4-amino-4,6-dideoxygalactose transaminase